MNEEETKLNHITQHYKKRAALINDGLSKYWNRYKKQTKSIESNYQNQLKSLENLKKSLLEKAFSGRLS